MSSLNQKVQKLLALAASDNKHEAEQALKKANELIAKHNINLTSLKVSLDYCVESIYLGKRRPVEHVYITSILREFFFVKTLMNRKHDGLYFVLMGTAENVKNAQYVYNSLKITFKSLSKGMRAKGHFYEGLSLGFSQKLREQKVEMTERGLVVVADQELNKFVKEKYPNTRNVSASMKQDNSAYEKGKSLGRNLNINKPIERNVGATLRIA